MQTRHPKPLPFVLDRIVSVEAFNGAGVATTAQAEVVVDLTPPEIIAPLSLQVSYPPFFSSQSSFPRAVGNATVHTSLLGAFLDKQSGVHRYVAQICHAGSCILHNVTASSGGSFELAAFPLRNGSTLQLSVTAYNQAGGHTTQTATQLPAFADVTAAEVTLSLEGAAQRIIFAPFMLPGSPEAVFNYTVRLHNCSVAASAP